MFDFIRGLLKDKEPLKTVVETGGIGYRIATPLSAFSKLPALDAPLTLFLSQVIREDSHTLYGFLLKEERDLFEILITLSGVGPKTALNLIGHMELSAFHHAISSADTRLLSKIPGIGKKTAERLVMEMRDKLKFVNKKDRTLSGPQEKSQGLISDAIHVLLNLGYGAPDAQKAVQAALADKQDPPDLSSLISLALKKI